MDDIFDDFDDVSDDSDDNLGMDDPFVDDSGIEGESTDDDMCDDEFTTKEAVIFGMAMNFAYEEGMEEAERRKLEKKIDDDRERRGKQS